MPHVTAARTFPLGVINLPVFAAGVPQGPVPAADVAVCVGFGQLVTTVHMVDVDFLAAPADVIDLEGAAGAVPFLVLDKGEGGVGAEGEDKKSGEAYELHWVGVECDVVFKWCLSGSLRRDCRRV